MTLEIEAMIILELTRNRNLENFCEKHGKTWKISVKNLENTWKIRQTNLENEVNCVVQTLYYFWRKNLIIGML